MAKRCSLEVKIGTQEISKYKEVLLKYRKWGIMLKKIQKFSDLEKGYFLFFIFYFLSFFIKNLSISFYSYVGTKTTIGSGSYQHTFEGVLVMYIVAFAIMSLWFILFLYLIKKNHSKIKFSFKSFYFFGYLILMFILFHFITFIVLFSSHPLAVYIAYPEIRENLSFIAYLEGSLLL